MPPADPEVPLYYLVRPGTSIYATTLDRKPVRVEDHAVEAAIRYYDRKVPLYELGSLEAMHIDAWHRRFRLPVKRARATADMEAHAEATVAAEAPASAGGGA